MKPDARNSVPELTVNRHYNKKELRFLLGNISLYYLNRMLENTPECGQPLGIWFSPRQVMVLVREYGLETTFVQNQLKYNEKGTKGIKP